jgi:hypothetical protein
VAFLVLANGKNAPNIIQINNGSFRHNIFYKARPIHQTRGIREWSILPTEHQMRHYGLIALLMISLLGCEENKALLFYISEPTKERNDFLFMTESTNVASLKDDSLKLFLRVEEYVRFDSTSTSYKNFGKIYTGEKFRVFVLLKSIDTLDRNYTFLIRTFDNHWTVIDDFELATYDQEKSKFCFGSIDNNLIIERRCGGNQPSETMQITNEGKVILRTTP